jgi:hypothetical protein
MRRGYVLPKSSIPLYRERLVSKNLKAFTNSFPLKTEILVNLEFLPDYASL